MSRNTQDNESTASFLDREPVRRGPVYCAPWCGGGCTHVAFVSVTKAAAALAKRMGKGWKPRVWENLGWHYSVISPCGRWKLHPHHTGSNTKGPIGRMTGVTAFLGDADSTGGVWAEHGKDARDAMRATWAYAKPDIDHRASFVDAGECI